jgi:ATP-dependent DNA helicase DinG
MEEIFGSNGLIAHHHPDYEHRPGQLAMAQAVAEALDQRHHLLVEAGTGIGKTLAYLIPAIATVKTFHFCNRSFRGSSKRPF